MSRIFENLATIDSINLNNIGFENIESRSTDTVDYNNRFVGASRSTDTVDYNDGIRNSTRMNMVGPTVNVVKSARANLVQKPADLRRNDPILAIPIIDLLTHISGNNFQFI